MILLTLFQLSSRFFFHDPPHHRYIHSFPTRRSSDLINSIITLNPKALEEADRLDAAYKRTGFVGPLHGIPVLVKDEIDAARSEEHTSELQSHSDLVCRLLLEKKNSVLISDYINRGTE